MPERVNYGKLREVLEIPDLIGVQIDSYKSFLQLGTDPDKRVNQGLQEVFNDVFPIASYDKQMVLEFVSYNIEYPKKDVVDCIKDGFSYNAALSADFRLKIKDAVFTERVSLGNMSTTRRWNRRS